MYDTMREYKVYLALEKNKFKKIKPSQQIKAFCAVPGQENTTASEYARSMNDKTVVQGELNDK